MSAVCYSWKLNQLIHPYIIAKNVWILYWQILLSDAICFTVYGKIQVVDSYLILSLKSSRELSNCRPLEFVQESDWTGKSDKFRGLVKTAFYL